jgi:hypothetical protein
VPAPRVCVPADVARLLGAVGLAPPFVAVLAAGLAGNEVRALLASAGTAGCTIALLADGVWLRSPGGELAELSHLPAAAAALAALLGAAAAVVATDVEDVRLLEARTLDAPVAVGAVADVPAILALAARARRETIATSDEETYVALVDLAETDARSRALAGVAP